jgi:leucyl aminopeptidase (aminopeptidase T)
VDDLDKKWTKLRFGTPTTADSKLYLKDNDYWQKSAIKRHSRVDPAFPD